MTRKFQIAIVMMLLVLPVALVMAGGQNEGVVNTNEDGVAIKGYDAVAYFTEGKPVQGSAEYTVEWDDATWWFSSEEHRQMFADDPERYAPKYGGYCAYAASQGQVAEGDPELWTIHEDRLYLNLNERFQRRFRDDLSGSIAAADENWPELRAELASALEE
ncbi:MAG: YHS domain-containing (seleno)protein [Alkalispirochaeta sp.]